MASTQPVAATSDTRRRVKLYILNEDRQWDDKGTGYVSSIFLDHLKGLSLLVKAESDGSTLLESRIQPDIAYQKQQETLIVWSQDDNYDLALSFQEKAGCDEIWEKICQVQGKDPSVDVTQDIVDESEDEQFDNMPDNSAGAPVELPPCEISKLEEIAELFQNVLPSPIRRERLSVAIENEGYVHKLLELFHVCEDLEILDGLHHLYDIFKAIFMLNKNALFEIMFADDVIYNVIGCLEYDPSLKKEPNSGEAPPQRIKHREYLKNQAKFKEVIPITNSDLLAKIHQTYRVSYIQEIVLPTPSVFEENMLTTLSSFIFFNKVEIVSMIQDDEKFLTQLFFSLKEDDTEETKRRDLVLFLKELCSFSQTLQPQNRESFFRTLSNQGILDALEILLGLEADSGSSSSSSSSSMAAAGGHNHQQAASTSADAESALEKEAAVGSPVDPSETPLAQIKAAAIDMFSFIVEFSPSMVREFVLQETQAPLPILQEDDADLLINLVIDQMISDMDPELGGAMQLMGILKILIDPENMVAQANKTEKTEFLTFFYKRSMPVLVAPILANTAPEGGLEKDDYRTAHLQYLILELLAFCVEHHTYHIRNYVLNKDFLRRVLRLFTSNHAFLALAALRFLRKIIGLKDEFYNRYIIKGNLFGPVIEAFNRNGQRYNLLNSALLEIFEFIRVEDIKSLITHIVETHWEAVKHVEYVQTFKNLKLRYEQQIDRAGGGAGGRGGGGGGSGGGGASVGEGNRAAAVGNAGNNIENMFLSMPSMLRNNRFRRDARALEEEEEMWFDQEEPDLDSADSNSARQVGDDDASPPNSLQSPPHVGDACDQMRDNAMDGMGGGGGQSGIISSGRDASVAEAASSSSSVEQRELQATFLAAAVAVGMSSSSSSNADDATSSSDDDDGGGGVSNKGFTSNATNEVVEGPADSIDFSKMVQRNFKSCGDDDDDDDDDEDEGESNVDALVESRFKISSATTGVAVVHHEDDDDVEDDDVDDDDAAEGADTGGVCSSTSGSTATLSSSAAQASPPPSGVGESGDGVNVLPSTSTPASSSSSSSSSSVTAVSNNHDVSACGDVSSGSSITASAIKHTSECFSPSSSFTSSSSSPEENGLSSTTSSTATSMTKAGEESSTTTSHQNEFVGDQMGLDFSSSSSSASSSSPSNGGVSLVTRTDFGAATTDSGAASVVDSSAKDTSGGTKDASSSCSGPTSSSSSFEATTRRRLPSIETIDPSAASASSSSLASLPAVSDIIGPSATPPGPFSQLAAGCSNAATVVTSSPLMAAAIEAMAAAAATSTSVSSGTISSSTTTTTSKEGAAETSTTTATATTSTSSSSSSSASSTEGVGEGEKSTSASSMIGNNASSSTTTSKGGVASNSLTSGNLLLDLSKNTNTAGSFLADPLLADSSVTAAAVGPQFFSSNNNNSDHCQSSSQVSSSTFYGQELASNLSSSPSSSSSSSTIKSSNRSQPSQSVSSSSSSASSLTSAGVSSNFASSNAEECVRSSAVSQRVGLVDYEGDSDDEDDEEDGKKDGAPEDDDDEDAPSLKRARL